MRTDADPVIEFQPVSDAHLPKLLDWLKEPHVRRWWGEPEREIELIRTGRSSGEAEGYMVHVEGEPVGYVQAWSPGNFDEEDWQKKQPAGTLGVDVFVGDPATTGRGLGPAIVRAFCIKLLGEGAERIVIDPDVANVRAVRAYRKAGFLPVGEYRSSDGATLLMRFDETESGDQA